MTVERKLHPELVPVVEQILSSGVFEGEISDQQRRDSFEVMAPVMWDPATLPVAATEDRELEGPAGAIPIRIYRPSTAPRLPVLVYFHGGGFTIGSLNTADAMCRFLCREASCIVVSSDYRLAPEHPFPAGVDDAWSATRWVGEHIDELGGDPSRLAVGGDAPGATFAAVVAQQAKAEGGPPLVFQLLLSPATDWSTKHPSRKEFADDAFIPESLIDAIGEKYVPDPADRLDPRCSPLLAADLSGLPPAYLLAAEYDPLRDEERAYADRLRDAGVPVIFECVPGTVHNFFSMSALTVAQDTMSRAATALRSALQ